MAKTIKEKNVMLDVVDKPQWKIGYSFTDVCPAAFRQQDEKLRELITKALQAWLQPLRDAYPDEQFPKEFSFVMQPDTAECDESKRSQRWQDVRLTFDCKEEIWASFVSITTGDLVPEVCMRGSNINHRNFNYVLAHELGHALGLNDTYTLKHRSTGGLAHTAGKQPASIMSGGIHFDIGAPFRIGEDDKNGVIWLYEYLHKGRAVDDCFFPDYVHDEETKGCQPKYPLIFEAKHGTLETVTRILNDDPNLELNGQDSSGNTALHYAVQRADRTMVELLLARAGIKVNILNKQRRNPAQWARQFRQHHLAKLIEAHPSAKWQPIVWDVKPQDKRLTTWGEMKKGDGR